MRTSLRPVHPVIAAFVILVASVAGFVATADDTTGPAVAVPLSTSTTSAASSTTTTSIAYPTVPAAPPTSAAYPTVEPRPIADLVSGELLGLPLGSAVADVIDALETAFGDVDLGAGWSEGCLAEEEWLVRAGGFQVVFHGDGGTGHLAGWLIGNDPAPEIDVRLHGGADTTWSMRQIVDANEAHDHLQVIDEWNLARLDFPEEPVHASYVGGADLDTTPDHYEAGHGTESCGDY